MKNSLDDLMQDRDLDALIVVGPGQHNPPMVYLTGGAHLTDAILVKIRGQSAVLFHRMMERDEAARSGLECRSLEAYRLDNLAKQMNGNLALALRERNRLLLRDLGLVSGRAAVCGRIDAGTALAAFSTSEDPSGGITFIGEPGNSVLLAAMETKDELEIDRIRAVGKLTTEVIDQTAEFLSGHITKDSRLVKRDGNPLTVGEVKRRINLWLAERGLENPEGMIFSIGRNAGVPHSTGRDSDWLRLGQTIIFDIFPCELGGGYHYDITRTWCLGYAPDEALALYEAVLTVYQQVSSELRLEVPCRHFQELTCQLFRQRGHPTIQDTPDTTAGYVHSLGHGVGLYVHERPLLRLDLPDDELLKPNVVVTVEPGLYYPERGLGVRLEDTFWMRPDGQAEVLAPYPLDLLLPVSN